MNTFYDFSATTLQNKDISMKEFQGKIILVVNTASKCGLTPQYKGLETLYKKYQDKGLVVLGFPCNQFANQEPGDAAEIKESCLVNYGVTFPMFKKIDVNGENAHPIFKFLRSKQPGVFGDAIKWNFTKFLIDGQGNPVRRFSPVTEPENIEKEIEALLEVKV